ncbi:chromate efflux transporter [Roseovarius faecimaris]|uniref:Chromate efflux transporter n=1 Tax=Roseovarius faecimaris TaxID=2494550 RepID=A0A6I6J0F7_9RHOB|nr:chromate efflux transporter [Roseovarius faecimaris]QGX98328.1 chromate efflux transporter [Roseovarius faecimaris]
MSVSYGEMFRVFGRIGLLSFGGPAAQISLMHEELVDKRRWLDEPQFLGALSFCMLLPGPEAMQLATFAGWRLRGIPGGLIAGLLFVLPGALVIAALALGYAQFGGVPLVQALFVGIKAAVVAIVLQALLKLSRKALTQGDHWVLAGLAFVAMFALSVPFPIVIACAAFWGALRSGSADRAPPLPTHHAPPPGRTALVAAVWLALWMAPVLWAWTVEARFLLDLGLFFSKLAVVTFGGAYAVLAYMTQAVVDTHGWLTPEQMIDALGLAETTPGPLILVTEFVAILSGYLQGGPGLALTAGAFVLWVTFVPCFLWIFAAAPYVDALLHRPRLKGALAGISAAVVGVILNLSVWFALHVLFGDIHATRFGPLPELSSFAPLSAALVVLAAVFLLVMRLPMLSVLGLMAALAAIASIFG